MPGNLEPARVEAELAQHGRVDVGHVVALLDGVEAQLVRRAVGQSSLDAGAGHPAGEAERVMIAAAPSALDTRRAAELGPPNYDRLREQPALLQILEQSRERPVHAGAQLRVVLLQLRVGIPTAGIGLVTLENLHEAHAALDESARRQADLAEGPGLVAIQPVELLRLGALVGEAQQLRHRRLHPEGKLVGLDPGPQDRVLRILDRVQPIQPVQEFELALLFLLVDLGPRERERQRIVRIHFDTHAPVLGPEIGRSPDGRAAKVRWYGRPQYHEFGQVLVERAETIVHPRAD